MYKVLKDKGNNQNITLINMDTKASVIIGKISISIMGILEREIELDESREGTIKLKDKWDFEVSDETGRELARTASPIKKPVRTKEIKDCSTKTAKASAHKKITKSGREVVDVFDLIYGIN